MEYSIFLRSRLLALPYASFNVILSCIFILIFSYFHIFVILSSFQPPYFYIFVKLSSFQPPYFVTYNSRFSSSQWSMNVGSSPFALCGQNAVVC